MSFVYDIVNGLLKSLEWVKAKVGTVLLVVFALGLLAGRWFALQGFPFWFYIVPFLVIPVMWRDLDQGVAALALFYIIAFALL